MAGAAGKVMVAPLALLNFCMYMVILGIAGWGLNRTMDHEAAMGLDPARAATLGTGFGNRATLYLLIFSLIAGVVGAASALAGLIHVALWRSESLAGAAATALAAWGLTLLAFGLACKEIHSTGRDRKLKALESFTIILAFFQLVYVIILHAAIFTGRHAPRDPGYGEPHMKAPAASAV